MPKAAPASEIPARAHSRTSFRSMGRGGMNRCSEPAPARAHWPEPRLQWVPSLDEAEALTTRVRSAIGLAPDVALRDLSPLLSVANCSLALADLHADRGGNEALLVPLPDGRFSVRVDPRPRGGWGSHRELRDEMTQQRLRFRVAHEIGHTFFYERAKSGLRRRLRGSAAEERFCDHFAAALLVPPEQARARPLTAKSAIELHRCFDVSVELAGRALAAAHPDAEVIVGYWPSRSKELLLQWGTRAGRAATPACLHSVASSPSPDWSAERVPPPRRQMVFVRSKPAAADQAGSLGSASASAS